MSDSPNETTPSRTIPLGRAIAAGLGLLTLGATVGILLGQASAPTLASAPRQAARQEAVLTNMGTEPSNPLTTGQLSDLMRGSQDRESSLQSTAPFEIGQPLQRTGPINGQLALGAGAMPVAPREMAWTELNDRVANVLGNGVPTREALEQLVGLVTDPPPVQASPIVLTGGTGQTPIASPIAPPTPLPPPVYEGTNKASPN